jgi:hypothetical protein
VYPLVYLGKRKQRDRRSAYVGLGREKISVRPLADLSVYRSDGLRRLTKGVRH